MRRNAADILQLKSFTWVESTNDRITCVRNETFPSNSYILRSPGGNECILIDPGLDALPIDKKITELQTTPIAILATHGHFDHIGSASFFKKKYNVPLYMHQADMKLLKAANFYIKMARINHVIDTPTVDVVWQNERESVTIVPFHFNIYNFPGHSFGSCVLQYENVLFSGDIIYKKGLGFNNFPGEDRAKLRTSILAMFELFSADAVVLPGHGPSEYLGNIRSGNEDLIAFLSKDDKHE